jgi:hypothetical protein
MAISSGRPWRRGVDPPLAAFAMVAGRELILDLGSSQEQQEWCGALAVPASGDVGGGGRSMIGIPFSFPETTKSI